MGMTMNREFSDDLLDTESDAYKALYNEVKDLVSILYLKEISIFLNILKPKIHY